MKNRITKLINSINSKLTLAELESSDDDGRHKIRSIRRKVSDLKRLLSSIRWNQN